MDIKSNKKIEFPLFYKRLQNILDILLQENVVERKKDFAEILGKSLQNLNMTFSRKDTNPKVSIIFKLVETFNVNPMYFYYKDAPMFLEEKVETKQTFETDKEKELYNQVNELKSQNKELKQENEKVKAAARLLLKSNSEEK